MNYPIPSKLRNADKAIRASEDIGREDLLTLISEVVVATPNEQLMATSSPGVLSLKELKKEQFHIPESILLHKLSPEATRIARQKLGFWVVPTRALGIHDPTGGEILALSYEDIDPETGETVRDPRVLGVYESQTDTYHPVEERDLNYEVYHGLKTSKEIYPEMPFHPYDYLREGKSLGERESVGDPEKG